MTGNKYYDDSYNMHMSLIRAIYRAIGHPLPEPAPEPTPEPEPEPPIVEPIDEAEAAHQALIAQIAKFKYIRGWHISHTDRNVIETRCAVPIDGPKDSPYSVCVCWGMTLAEFIKYQTPIEEQQARYEVERERRPWSRTDQPTTTQRPYSPIPLDYIKQELDKQGYDFLPGMFLAIKRTGMWRVEGGQ
jgi:hypothetical protein